MSQDPTQHGPYEQRPGRPGEPAEGHRGERPRETTPEADRPVPHAPDFAPPSPGQQPYGRPYGQPGQPGQPGQQYGQPGQQYGQPGHYSPAPGQGGPGQAYGHYSPTPPQYGPQPTSPTTYGVEPPAPYGVEPPSAYGASQEHGAEGAKDDNPFNALFDLSFTQYATPVVIRVLYILLILVGGISWLVSIVSGFAWSGASGLGALVGGAIVLAAWVLLVRVTLEFFLSIIRVAQDAQAIREGLEELRPRTGREQKPDSHDDGNTAG